MVEMAIIKTCTTAEMIRMLSAYKAATCAMYHIAAIKENCLFLLAKLATFISGSTLGRQAPSNCTAKKYDIPVAAMFQMIIRNSKPNEICKMTMKVQNSASANLRMHIDIQSPSALLCLTGYCSAGNVAWLTLFKTAGSFAGLITGSLTGLDVLLLGVAAFVPHPLQKDAPVFILFPHFVQNINFAS